MAKIEAATHEGEPGQTIIEMIEDQLYSKGREYVRIRSKQEDYESEVEWHTSVQNYRGQIRGLALSLALLRHPTRRYSQPWWDYVKKLEKRAVTKARADLNTV
jgi:hypothetical protein